MIATSSEGVRKRNLRQLGTVTVQVLILLVIVTANGSELDGALPSGTSNSAQTGPAGAPCSWSAGPDLPSVAVRSVGIFFPANGRFYAMGGRISDAAGSDFTHPFEFDPKTSAWTTKGATYPDNQVNNMACGVLTDAGTPYIYCVGGSAAGQTTAASRVFRYDPVTDAISPVAAPWPGNTGDVLPGGFSVFANKLYILGGFQINTQMVNSIYEFTPGTNAWVQKSSFLPVALGFVPTTTIGTHIYTGGGSTWDGASVQDTNNSFVYDPAADTIAAIASIPRSTGETRALNINDQMWVLGGGRTAPNPSNEVNIYDPVSNAWSVGTPFTTARRNFPADTDGTRVWLAGGYDSSGITPLASMEIFRCVCPGDQYTIGPGTPTLVPGTTDTGNRCDDCDTAISLPFSFQLYDQTFTAANVNSNGRVDFATVNEPGGFATSCLPASPNIGPFDLTIFPLWQDMRTDIVGEGCAGFPTGCGVFTSVSGTAPNRIFNIEWRTVLFANHNATQNFELRLFENDPNKRFDVVIGGLITTNADHNYVSGVQGNAAAGVFTQDFCTLTPPLGVARSYTSTGCQISTLANISTRLRVETGNNVLIGGFIITGTQPKKVILRAIGPSLPVAGALINPFLELRDSAGNLILSNDNWRTNQEQEIIDTGIPPSNDLESAIVATLPANNSAYTAVVSGANNGTGVGLVEVYDLDRTVDSKLANISTRGFVQTNDNVLIGGLIVVGQTQLRVIVRAIGPSLPVSGALANPILELHDGSGTLIASNDDWRTTQEAEIIATGIPPSNDLESAIVRDLAPGNYTAIVRGVDGATGVALVEAYGLN